MWLQTSLWNSSHSRIISACGHSPIDNSPQPLHSKSQSGRRETQAPASKTRLIKGLMKNFLAGKKVAILVTDGFEQVELTGPKEALEKAGAETDIISPAGETVKGWDMTKWGKTFRVDVPLKKAKADDYDALLLPGGVMNPDKL